MEEKVRKLPGRPKGSKSRKATRPELKWVLERIHLDPVDVAEMTNRKSWIALHAWAHFNVDKFMNKVLDKGFEERREKNSSEQDRVGDVAGVLEGLLAGWEGRKPRSVTTVNREEG